MAAASLTIEQLAAQTGMTVRNIRAHQARGLLAPPEVRLRVGYYGPEHVAQAQADPRPAGSRASTWRRSSTCSTTASGMAERLAASARR